MKKGYQVILLSTVMICAVFTFVTIAWAAFNTTLTIGGTATVKAQKWNVYFKSAAVDSTATTAENVSIDSIGTSTSTITLSSLAASFDTPGEKAVYNITIDSDSTFDAKLTEYTEPTITCTSDAGATSYTPTTGFSAYQGVSNDDYSAVDPAALVCGFISYEYVIGSTGFAGTKMATPPAAGTKLNTLVNTFVFDSTLTTGGDHDVDMVLTIYFDKNKSMKATALPTKDVTVSFTNLKTKFTQA